MAHFLIKANIKEATFFPEIDNTEYIGQIIQGKDKLDAYKRFMRIYCLSKNEIISIEEV